MAARIARSTVSVSPAASISHAALGFRRGDRAVAAAQPLMELGVERLEAVGGGAARGTRQALRDRQIEDQSQVGTERAQHKSL
jgi:hypothetical protein